MSPVICSKQYLKNTRITIIIISLCRQYIVLNIVRYLHKQHLLNTKLLLLLFNMNFTVHPTLMLTLNRLETMCREQKDNLKSPASMSTIKLFECRPVLARNRIILSFPCTLQHQCRQYIAWNVARYLLKTVFNIILLHSPLSMSTIYYLECRPVLARNNIKHKEITCCVNIRKGHQKPMQHIQFKITGFVHIRFRCCI